MPTVITILKYGLLATVVTEESDRPAYVPPPVARGEHAGTCGCASCLMARVNKRVNETTTIRGRALDTRDAAGTATAHGRS